LWKEVEHILLNIHSALSMTEVFDQYMDAFACRGGCTVLSVSDCVNCVHLGIHDASVASGLCTQLGAFFLTLVEHTTIDPYYLITAAARVTSGVYKIRQRRCAGLCTLTLPSHRADPQCCPCTCSTTLKSQHQEAHNSSTSSPWFCFSISRRSCSSPSFTFFYRM
jgi:hypothetical protein